MCVFLCTCLVRVYSSVRLPTSSPQCLNYCAHMAELNVVCCYILCSKRLDLRLDLTVEVMIYLKVT